VAARIDVAGAVLLWWELSASRLFFDVRMLPTYPPL
jgi:hypothetical protein